MDDDAAGPLLGWSLGALLNHERASDPGARPLDELVQFPCVFLFKAVGRAGEDFASTMIARVGQALGRDVRDDETSVRQSAQGNYESVTLKLYVTSGDEVYSVYEAIRADARVKFLL
jgi:putative lipoic acid-binding regulatory protein